MKSAIVIGGFVNALGLVRSLHEFGARVAVVTNEPHDLAHLSRYVATHRHLPGLRDDPEPLAEWLMASRGSWGGAAIYPTTDLALACLDRYRETLSAFYRLVIPPPETIRPLLDRRAMMRAAQAVGIATPRHYGSPADTLAQPAGPEYPVLVKPLRSDEFRQHFGVKLFVARDAGELASCADRLAAAGMQGDVFAAVPGPDRSIHAHCAYLDGSGSPLAECTVRKLRQSPAGFGIARVAERVPAIPELREQAIELLRHIGHRGLGAVEFKHDARDGTHRFIEVNGRSVVYNRLLQKAGLDVAVLGWQDFVDRAPRATAPSDWSGVWIHLHADILRSVLQSRRDESVSLAQYTAPYRRPKVFAVWSAQDPRPFGAQWRRTAAEAWRHVLAGGNRGG